MRNSILAMAFIAFVPVAGFAQKGAKVDNSMPADAPSSGGSTVKTPSSRDLSDMNPASLLIDRRKKLSLADSTVTQLKAVQKKINDRNSPFYSSYDSTRKWTMSLSSSSSSQAAAGLHGGTTDSKLTAGGASAAEQAKMQSSLRDLRVMMGDFRDRRKADVADALGVIPEAQKKAATEALDAQDAELEKLLGGRS